MSNVNVETDAVTTARQQGAREVTLLERHDELFDLLVSVEDHSADEMKAIGDEWDAIGDELKAIDPDLYVEPFSCVPELVLDFVNGEGYNDWSGR